jgi:hypothetical protein
MNTLVRATIAAATISCCGVMTAATTAANPPDFDLSHHPAPALAPGVGLGIYNAEGNPVDTCTAGWLVHDTTGQAGLLTAGHCDDGGGATYFNKATGFQIAGWFTHKAYDGDHGEDADIAELGIGNSPNEPEEVPTDTRIIGIRPVIAPADDTHLAEGQQLCHYGLITGPQHRGRHAVPSSMCQPQKCGSWRPSTRATPAGRSITATPTAPPPRLASPSVRRIAVAPSPN